MAKFTSEGFIELGYYLESSKLVIYVIGYRNRDLTQ